MIVTAIVLFLIGALAGLAMAVKIFRGQTLAWSLTLVHGVLVASALLVLAIAVWQGAGDSYGLTGLGVLLVAALGGFYLLSLHLRRKNHPKPVVVVHALLAVTGVLILLAAVLQAQTP